MEGNFDFSKKADKQKLYEYLRTLNGTYRVVIERETRRQNWNRYYWGVVIKILSDYTGIHKNDLHEVFKYMFNSFYYADGRKGEWIEGGTTKTLTQDRFIEYIDHIKQWVDEFTNGELYIPEIWEIQKA